MTDWRNSVVSLFLVTAMEQLNCSSAGMVHRYSLMGTAGCWLLMSVAVVFLSGCGESGIPRQPVFGKISGAEGRTGLVSFVPAEGTSGPAARASLVNGEYRFSRSDGPVPGNYTVIIQLEVSHDMTSGVAVFKGVEIPADSMSSIPAAYEAVTSLEVSVPDGAQEALQLDLELPET